MIQRMLNRVTINLPEIDLNTVTNIEVTFDQRSSGSEFTYNGENVVVAGEHTLVVTIPKEDAMQLDNKAIRGQVMYTVGADPFATKIFSTTVDELLKEDGYGD